MKGAFAVATGLAFLFFGSGIAFGDASQTVSPKQKMATYHFRLASDEIPPELKVGVRGDLVLGGAEDKSVWRVIPNVAVTCVRPYEGQFAASCAPTRGMRSDRNIQVCVELPYEVFLTINDYRGFCTIEVKTEATELLRGAQAELPR